jgi:3-carboxy-cis,cis-muconate cycloisomerase
VAALLAAMPQEHERALGGWQAEGAEWTDLLQLVAGSARAMAGVAAALAADEQRVNAQRMRDNIGAVRTLLPEDAAAQWFDPDAAAALAPEVARLCVRIEEILGASP